MYVSGMIHRRFLFASRILISTGFLVIECQPLVRTISQDLREDSREEAPLEAQFNCQYEPQYLAIRVLL